MTLICVGLHYYRIENLRLMESLTSKPQVIRMWFHQPVEWKWSDEVEAHVPQYFVPVGRPQAQDMIWYAESESPTVACDHWVATPTGIWINTRDVLSMRNIGNSQEVTLSFPLSAGTCNEPHTLLVPGYDEEEHWDTFRTVLNSLIVSPSG